MNTPTLDDVLGTDRSLIDATPLYGEGAAGKLPITGDMLLNEPSGNLFALTQNVGMGWNPEEVGRNQYLIPSTHAGLRAEARSPIPLAYPPAPLHITYLI